MGYITTVIETNLSEIIFKFFNGFLASAIVNLYAIFYCQEKICYPLWWIEKIVIKADGKSLNVVFLLLSYMVFLFVCLLFFGRIAGLKLTVCLVS